MDVAVAVDVAGLALAGVGVASLLVLHRQQVQAAVAHAALGADGVGEAAHVLDLALQDHRLHAVLVVEVHVQRGDAEVVVGVLRFHQPARELALVMVVDEREAGEAMAPDLGPEAVVAQPVAHQVAERLRAVAVALGRHVGVELAEKLVVHRDRDSLHCRLRSGGGNPGRVIAIANRYHSSGLTV